MRPSNRLFIGVLPEPAPRPKFNRKFGSAYMPAKYKKYIKQIKKIMTDAKEKKTQFPLRVCLTFYIPKAASSKLEYPKGDVDNYAKGILDAGNKLLWEDDSQIAKLYISKVMSSEKQGVDLRWRTLSETPYRVSWRKPVSQKKKPSTSSKSSKTTQKTPRKSSRKA